MAIPPHLLDAAVRHQRAGRRTSLLVRHAERHAVHDLRTHEEVRLTDHGHAQARAAGARVAAIAPHVRVLHSPIERCAETARGLVEGALAAGARAELVRPLEALAAPFILDKQRAFEIVNKIGPRFIREWFDGNLPADVFAPRAPAAHGQIDAVVEHLQASALTIFVSHDWNIALLREEILGFAPERGWPAYLDGVVISHAGDEITVEHDGRVGKRTRA